LPSGPIGEFPSPENCPPVPKNLGKTFDETDTIAKLRESYAKTRMTPVANFTPEKWRQLRWGYYRLIERTDLYIGKVLKALEESGKAENTLIIFTADHGDCTGAHGFAQKTQFYDEASRIPFIISYNGKIKPAVSEKLVNVGIDVLPTLMDYAGLNIPEKLKGLSVKKAIEAPNSWRDYIVTSNHSVQGADDSFQPRGRMVRTDRFKYSIYDLGNHRESLIDMQKDPYEMTNLARNPEHQSTLKVHQKILKEYAEKNGDKVALEIIEGK
jgi:arylsulfatase A-like enzyme